jgi:hypothetical protein
VSHVASIPIACSAEPPAGRAPPAAPIETTRVDAWLSYLVCGQAESRLAQGDLTAAADAAAAIVAEPPAGVTGPRQDALLVLALVRARRGDPDCWPLLDEAREVARSVGELQYPARVAVARRQRLMRGVHPLRRDLTL